MTLNSLTSISRSRRYLMLNISETVQHSHNYNEILVGTLYARFSSESFISNDLDWLSEIFNDTKQRMVCLRQLSFL